MTEDAELLRSYAEHQDEDAFAEVVRRHLGVVYQTALRQCGGDAHHAKDVAQAVFIALARKAAKLASRPSLAGWLYTSTRYAAVQAVRTAARRRARELKACDMDDLIPSPNNDTSDWKHLSTVVDDALYTLNKRDREAVLLRFFEDRSFADVGARLSISEDAARMRVERALEKMRRALATRGATSTTTALAAALATQASASLPAGLAATITGVSLASVTVGGGSMAALIFTNMSILKTTTVTALIAAGALGIAWQHQLNTGLESEVSVLRSQSSELAQLRAENVRLKQMHTKDTDTLSALSTNLAAASNIQKTASSGASSKPSLSLLPELRSAASLTNAGKSTPEASVETLFWAMIGADVQTLADTVTLSPKRRQSIVDMIGRLPADKQASYGSPEQAFAMMMASTTPIAGLQVMSNKLGAHGNDFDPSLANDPNYQTVHLQRQDSNGRVREQDMVFQKTAKGWRWAVP